MEARDRRARAHPRGSRLRRPRAGAGFVFKHDAVVLGVGISVSDGGVDGQLLDETVDYEIGRASCRERV